MISQVDVLPDSSVTVDLIPEFHPARRTLRSSAVVSETVDLPFRWVDLRLIGVDFLWGER